MEHVHGVACGTDIPPYNRMCRVRVERDDMYELREISQQRDRIGYMN